MRMEMKQLIVVIVHILLLRFPTGHTMEPQKRGEILTKRPHSKLGSLLALTRDYLRNANIYNTTVEFTVPLFSFKLPAIDDPDNHTALIRQNLLGQLVYFAVVVISFLVSIAFPVYINNLQPQERSLFSLFKNADIKMKRLNFLKHFDSNTCFQQALCEAQSSYEEYGMIAVPFLYLSMFSKEFSSCRAQSTCPFSLLRAVRYVLRVVQKYFHVVNT